MSDIHSPHSRPYKFLQEIFVSTYSFQKRNSKDLLENIENII